ncbi:hypothetical protein ACIBF5_18700 [Micromonospora sp. NPDC050417]|uniref:hypothetical protein n=1 Tax=Micromonospora sp. NPDC050417 TaxID=3364280 RepID=UPI0037B25D84
MTDPDPGQVRTDDGGGDGGWSLRDVEVRESRPARLAKSAANGVTVAELVDELHRLSTQELSTLQRELKVRAGASAHVVAQSTRTMLARVPEERAAWVLHDALHFGVRSSAMTGMLTEGELAALLRADPSGLGFLTDTAIHDPLRDIRQFGNTSAVRGAVWSSMVSTGHPGAVAALGWLVAELPGGWTDSQAQIVRRLWRQVCQRLPLLPEHPVALGRLVEIVAELDRAGGAGPVPAADRVSAAANGHPSQVGATAGAGATSEELADLSARCDAVESVLGQLRRRDLPALAQAAEAGRIPPAAELDRMIRLAAEMEDLFVRVAAATGVALPTTVEQARSSLAETVAASSTLALVARVRQLTTLSGPTYVVTEIQQVADLAATVDADSDPTLLAGLEALVTAIDIGVTDPERCAELARRASQASPGAALLCMLPGTLALRARPASATAESAGPVEFVGPVEPVEAAPAPEAGGDVEEEGEVEEEVEGESVAAASVATPEVIGPEPSVPEPDEGTTTTRADEPDPDPLVVAAGYERQLTDADIHGNGRFDGGAIGLDPTLPGWDVTIDEVVAALNFTIPAPRAASESLVNRPASASASASAPAPAPVPLTTADAAGTPPGVDALYTTLLNDRQYALASWLLEAAETPVPVVAAHRLAAHAAAMRTSAGSNAAAFADAVRQLDAEALHDRLDVQMLVYAASVRAGLLSPIAGAAGPLRDVTSSIVKSGSAVENLTEALLTAIYNGAYLTPSSVGAVAGAAEAEAEHAALARVARDMLQSAPSRTIRYQAATELWQAWMAPGGYLGAPLTIVAAGSRDVEELSFVRHRIRELRAKSSLEALLDQDTRRPQSGKRTRRIEARAREKVLDWTSDVTVLLTNWVEATEKLTRPAAGTWMADPMAELRTRVNAVRGQALDELAALSGTGHEARDAAVQAGLALLTESLELLDGTATLSGPEIPAERVIVGALTLAPTLPIASELTLSRRVEVGDVAVAVDALRAGPAGWTAAFEQRAAQHDQVGTHILIEVLRPSDPQLAQRLSTVRDRSVADSTEQLDGRVAALAASIDADRRFGRMTADQWADLSTRARAYEAAARGPRRDFDTMLKGVGRIEADREATARAAISAIQWQLAEIEVPAAARSRIDHCIETGDLTTANEYLETVRGGRELPGPRADVDHLRLFYPVFPAMFANAAAAAGPKTGLLTELERAIDDGRNPSGGGLVDALTGAGVDLSQIGRPEAASGRISQWLALSSPKSFDQAGGGTLSRVKAILEQLGFLVDKTNTPRSRRGQSHGRSYWMHLTGVRATSGKALIPAFGSAISPSGDTLRLLAVWRSPTPQELVELLRSEPADHSVVVLYFGTLDVAARRELASQFRSGRKLPVAAVVDDAAFAYLVAQPEPGRDITMAITLPFTSATPFTPDVAGLVPQEMFYGRAEERDKVVDMMGSCIVYGGRQLGKSALLRAATREFDDGDSRHAIYLSIYKVGQANPVDAVWTTLWPRLADKGIVPSEIPSGDIATALTGHVSVWTAARPGRQLLLLLDESDSFLDADATDGRFTHVTHFKELMEGTGRAVKVVFAGLHQTARFERLANHPLAHFGDPVCVGPLAPQPAYDLLTRPLHALGYQFTGHDHAARVLALANNQPALIQLFGAQLLRNLQRAPMAPGAPPQHVAGNDVEIVWADDALRNSFRKRFDWTLNLDPRYKVIAYSVAFHAHGNGVGSALTATQLRAECEQWWPQGFAPEDVRTGEFRALLDECVDLGVLSYANGGYRLRTPNVLDLLGSKDEVDEFLEQAESTPLPESFDGSLMRPAFGAGLTRGPLTSRQIADLLAPRSQVRLIAGSSALTVERCIKAIEDENNGAHSGSRRSHLCEAKPSSLRNTCQQATVKAAGGHAVVLVDLKAATLDVARDAWRTARELIAAHSGGTLGIVLVTTPSQAPLWLTAAAESDASSGLTGLRRYDKTDLRLWLTETTLPFQDDASRGELLATTGGWPVNVNLVAEELSHDNDAGTRADPLARIRSHLADPVHAEALVAASGAGADAALEQAWTFLASEFADDRADAETIAEYLTLHGESGDPGTDALGSAQLARSGYLSTADVVDVLRTLGLLVASAEDGQLFVEPVMAAATRTVRG